MSKRVIVLHGSPRRKSNTRMVAEMSIQAARDEGAIVYEIDAIRLEFEIPGCAGCMKCHQSDDFGCVVGDQVAESIAVLPNFDVIVIATPLYWMSYPAQLKILIDRMGALMKFNELAEIRTPLAGKTFALLSTCNGPLENNMDLLDQQWRSAANHLSCQFNSCLFPSASVEAGIRGDDSSVLNKAQEFGRLLASL